MTDDPRDDFEPVREWQASVEFTATPRVERDLDDILGDLLDALHDRDGVPGHHQPDDGRGVYSASLTVRGASMFAAFRDLWDVIYPATLKAKLTDFDLIEVEILTPDEAERRYGK